MAYTIRYTVDGQSTTFDVTVVQPASVPTLSLTPTVTPTSTSTATPAPTQVSANAGTGAPRTGEDSGTTLQILAVVAFLIATGSVGVLHVTHRRRTKTSRK